MRVEPFAVGSYIHAVKRGARGIEIVHNMADRERFLRILYFLNDHHYDENWENGARTQKPQDFCKPEGTHAHEPLVEILCYTLMPNHLHLMLGEIVDGGVTLFMKKLGQSMTTHSNLKYKQKGSLFQGAYRSRTINNDAYLRYAAAYIMVKNTCELYPKSGLRGATENFEDAWQWAIRYRFSSLGEYAGACETPICTKTFLKEVFGSPKHFKSFARDVLLGGKWLEDDVKLE